MNRRERLAIARQMRDNAKAWPEELAPVPREEWPLERPGHLYPSQLWRSRFFLVQVLGEKAFGSVEVTRLSVCRTTKDTAGEWHENISWEELMRCKRQAGFGGHYAIEVYPRDRDIVNVANMRHLWVLSEPLPIGWFDGEGPSGRE